jgi:glyoxylase-like metal-dependent hydrolase (beta-lactamase superfamily II)
VQIAIGGILIDAVVDVSTIMGTGDLYGHYKAKLPENSSLLSRRGWHDEDWVGLGRYLESGKCQFDFGSYVIRTPSRTILIDAGFSPLMYEPYRSWRTSSFGLEPGLSSLSLAADDITDVVITHLHLDHLGWLTVEGRPYFRNAAIHIHSADIGHFRKKNSLLDQILTPLDAHLAPWSGALDLGAGIGADEAPGHTPGTCIPKVERGHRRVMFLGDVVHTPVELVNEGWVAFGDSDPDPAERTRAKVAQEALDSGTIIGGGHFPGLVFGCLVTDGSRREWRQLDESVTLR